MTLTSFSHRQTIVTPIQDLSVKLEFILQDKHRKGRGLTIQYGWHASIFGNALIMTTQNRLCSLAFADHGQEEAIFKDTTKRWLQADFIQDALATAPFASRVFDTTKWCAAKPLAVALIGTEFDLQVWQALLTIPLAKICTYLDIATQISKPKGSQAVGQALGRNPLAFVVPCHRVIGKSGKLTGYHWGLDRKTAMLDWEAAQAN